MTISRAEITLSAVQRRFARRGTSFCATEVPGLASTALGNGTFLLGTPRGAGDLTLCWAHAPGAVPSYNVPSPATPPTSDIAVAGRNSSVTVKSLRGSSGATISVLDARNSKVIVLPFF